MSLHRATRDLSAPAPSPSMSRQLGGPVVLFIGAVLIAGLTCILYLWQQSQIVAGSQDIKVLDARLTVLQQQYDDLQSQEQSMRSVTRIVAQALKYGMVMGNQRSTVTLQLPTVPQRPSMVAQFAPAHQQPVLLPATNAAITGWWESAWDGLYSLLQ